MYPPFELLKANTCPAVATEGDAVVPSTKELFVVPFEFCIV